MTKLALALAVACLMPSLGNAATSAVSAVNPSTSTAVQWPDYHAKPWVVVRQADMLVGAEQPVAHSDFIVGPGRFLVRVGTKLLILDNPDPQKADMEVVEIDLLGNGPSLRMLIDRENRTVLDLQLKVNGSWWSVPNEDQVQLRLLDPNALFKNDQMAGVSATVVDPGGNTVKVVRYENKTKK
ncbi:hypothetical protein KGO95_04000 [Patescibacteria group bacterium]|nr:hypothetical protein [Patescibacteria group bacterium]